MKTFLKAFSKVLLAMTVAATVYVAKGVESSTPPPRGHAYGYWMKDGTRVMFFYVDEDGSRRITLMQAKPNASYRVETTLDMKTWRTLADLRIGHDGTATCSDYAPQPYSFYRVIPFNKVF